MPENADAAERGRLLRGPDPVSETAPAIVVQRESDWSHIPAQQILVVEHEGSVIGAVTVDTEEGRVLYSQETTPCPTCKQDWTRGDRLEGEVKILWPGAYKNLGPSQRN